MKKNKVIIKLIVLSSALIVPSSAVIFTSCSNNQPLKPINVVVPTINGLSFSNLSGNVGQRFSTCITVDPTITNKKGLPNNLQLVSCDGRVLTTNEYIYKLNGDKIYASLEILAIYVKGDITIDFGLVDIQYTVKFNLNGGAGDTPEDQRFVYGDKKLVDEPYVIPVIAKYDFDGWYVNNTRLYDFSKPVTSDLVLYAHYIDEPQYAITATKDGQQPLNLNSLEEFRDKVNSGENDGFDGWLVKLNKNVNLNNVVWTPIGNSTHPFKGVFDGNNKFIYNYQIAENATTPDPKVNTLGGGLFGYIEGYVSSFTHETPITEFYDNNTYQVHAPTEDKFSCVIKNIKLRGVTTTNLRKENDDDYTAALVSSIKDAYISNIRLDYSDITATNKVGGIVGIVNKECIALFNKLITVKNVTVNGNGNHVAGVYARVYGTSERVFALNCQNNSSVNGKGINTGGITGQSKLTLFHNCVNNGTINGTKRSAGIGTDIQQSVFIECTNNGNVSQTELLPDTGAELDAPGGIASFGSQDYITMYKCKNTGTIGSSGNEKITAGIISSGISINSTVKECENTGLILSTRAYDICELSNVPAYKTETSLQVLNEHLGFNKYVIANNIILTQDDKTLKPTEQLQKIELNNLNSLNGEMVLDLANVNTNKLELYVNNCYLNVINGDVSKSILIHGSNNHITINSPLYDVTIGNNSENESTIVFNNNVHKITLCGNGKVNCTIPETTVVELVNFKDTGNFTLINKGTISHKATSGSDHIISTITACTITIYNYGKIEGLEKDSQTCAWTLLFYNDAQVTLYAGNESYIKCDQRLILSINKNSTVKIYYKDGAKLYQNKTESVPYSSLAREKVSVEPWVD